ncbi:MAG: DUF3006 domain-containing protein [Methanoregula sp.]|jgi:antitoxin component of MazEF toxin-antitoxin module|nr:DUF3006 domain-containing protein [Methanoregula sp.]
MKATVDSITGDVVRLITRDGELSQITIPRSLLPVGCREGDVVTISIEYDMEATSEAKNRAADLIDRLRKKSR